MSRKVDTINQNVAAAVSGGQLQASLSLATCMDLVGQGRDVLQTGVKTVLEAMYNGALAANEMDDIIDRCQGPATHARAFELLNLEAKCIQPAPTSTADKSNMILAVLGELAGASLAGDVCRLVVICVNEVNPPLKTLASDGPSEAWLRSFVAARDSADYTHSSLLGCKDPVVTTGKLQIPDTDEEKEGLGRAIMDAYVRGDPHALVEVRTKNYPFCEDIDMDGTADASMDHLITGSDYAWLKFRAGLLHACYPGLSDIKCVIFTSSRMDADRGLYKTGFHLRWSNLVVDKERAIQLRQQAVEEFTAASLAGQPFAATLSELKQGGREGVPSYTKEWNDVFDIAVIKGSSLRMPYCDKVSSGRNKAKLGAVLKAVGIASFSFSGDDRRPTVELTWDVAQEGGLSVAEWVKKGSIRLADEDQKITQWVQPALKTQPIKSKGKLRRAEGPSLKAARQVGSYAADQGVPSQFEFTGTPEELSARLIQTSQVEAGGAKLEQSARPGVWTWSHPDIRGTVQFTPASNSIKIDGPKRTLAKYLESFAVAVAVDTDGVLKWRATTQTSVYTAADASSDVLRALNPGEVVRQGARAILSDEGDKPVYLPIQPEGYVQLGLIGAQQFNFTSNSGVNYMANFAFEDASAESSEMAIKGGDMLYIEKMEEGWSSARRFADETTEEGTGWVPTEYIVAIP